MSEDKIEVDDYVRWLGKQKPVGLAWIAFAILQLAAASFIMTEAYIRYSEYTSTHEINNQVILEKILEKYKQ